MNAAASDGLGGSSRPAALNSSGTALAIPRPQSAKPITAGTVSPISSTAPSASATSAIPPRSSLPAPRRSLSTSPPRRATAIPSEKPVNAIAAAAALAPAS